MPKVVYVSIINCLVVRENAYFELIGLLECNGLAKVVLHVRLLRI